MASIRNILLVTFDQWRADHLSVAGHPTLKTPKLDAFAEDAVRFTNHYTVAAPCGPARASLLSGLYMSNHRVCRNGSPLDDRFTTLALELRKAGYDRALVANFGPFDDPDIDHFAELRKMRLLLESLLL